MRDAQKPSHLSLSNIITRLREGRYVIPDFQRDFEWSPVDISALISSIFRDYYIGSLLLWKGKEENFDALACQSIYGFNGTGERSHIVLDGQQRLTAMHYAFMAPDKAAPKRQNRFLFFIKVDRFMQEEYDDAFVYYWTRRGLNLLNDRNEQFKTHMFPLSVVGASGWELPNWAQGYVDYWSKAAEGGDGEKNSAHFHAKNAERFGKHLSEITQQYQISYIELDRDLEIDKVCDIFTQINSRGIRLDVFDLINALLKPKGLRLRTELWQEAAPRLEFVETQKMNVYVLQVMSLLRQAYCSAKYLYYLLPGNPRQVRSADGRLNRQVLVDNANKFKKLWDEAVNALEKAINLLRHPREFGAISSRYLPYASILPVFAALLARINELPSETRLKAHRKLRFWYWASIFTYRYSGSVDSTSARDYSDIKAWFADDDSVPGVIADFRRSFRELDLSREVRRGTSIYNGTFNLLVLKGVRDWISGSAPQYGELDDHHIVPKSWGIEQETLHTPIDSLLNRTPLSSETNRKIINDRLPNSYLPRLIEENSEDKVLDILETHFISRKAFEILIRDPFTVNDFEEFIGERRRTLLNGIQDLLVKERLDLTPPIRELDASIEKVELELRRIIDKQLKCDINQLPPHILQKINERMRSAVIRSPVLDGEENETLQNKLEYADLRDLQETIGNKRLWARFQAKFGNKELLNTRFQQLADLRNSIRHSRTVGEIMLKEGEAALLWFQHLLDRDIM